jgi:hypothetical protein
MGHCRYLDPPRIPLKKGEFEFFLPLFKGAGGIGFYAAQPHKELVLPFTYYKLTAKSKGKGKLQSCGQ